MHLGLAAETIGESCHFLLNSAGTGFSPETFPISPLLVAFIEKDAELLKESRLKNCLSEDSSVSRYKC